MSLNTSVLVSPKILVSNSVTSTIPNLANPVLDIRKQKLSHSKLVLWALATIVTTISTFLNTITLFANQPEEFKIPAGAKRIEFSGLNNLIGTAILTLQFLSLGIAIILIVISGIKIMTSSDSHRGMEEAKSGIFKVIVGCFVVFSAATIGSLVFNALSIK